LKTGALSAASLHAFLLGASLAKTLAASFALLSILAAWRFFRHRPGTA
jgi:hypothetical protein